MVKRIAVVLLALLGAWSCAGVSPTPSAYFIEDIPADVSTHLSLGDRLAAKEAWEALRAGRVERAGKIVAGLGSTNPVYAVGMAYVDLLSGDTAVAEEGFKASLRSFPDMTPARVGLAQIYESRGESDKVINECREILKRDPENRWAKPRFEALRTALVREQYDAGIGAWKGGNREAAKTALLKALSYEPDYADAHYSLGLIYLEENNAASALAHFQSFQSLEKKDSAFREKMTQAYRQMAGLFYQKGEMGRSLELYEKLKELEPRDQEALKRIEEIKAKLGVFELPSQYAVIPTLEAIAREDLAALIGVKFEDTLDAPARRTQILVDIAMSWAQRFIVKVASLEIMSVLDNHTFQPRRIINRAELAETAVRLIGFLQARGAKFVPLVEARRVQVADVSPDSFFYPSIIRVLALQIMSVTPERMFEPERVVSGEEATRVMDLILRLAK